MLPVKFYTEAIDDINDIIDIERQRYKSWYDIIEQYAIKNDIILLHKDHVYSLYSSDMLYHAHELVNLLYVDSAYVVLLHTQITYKHTVVFIDHRLMVNFYECDPNAYINTVQDKFIMPSNETLLMSVYHKLYSPDYAADWVELMKTERLLIGKISSVRPDSATSNKQMKPNKLRNKCVGVILNNYVVNNNSIILVGETAVRLLIPSTDNASPIKLITDIDLCECYTEIRKVLSDANVKIKLSKKIGKMNIFGEFDLVRMVVRAGKTEILHVYNSGAYEMVPYNIIDSNESFIQIGSAFVLLRFLLIDVYILYRVNSYKEIKGYDCIMNRLLSTTVKLRKNLSKRESSELSDKYFTSHAMGVFQKKNYIGRYINSIIAQKVKLYNSDMRIHDYIPEAYMNKFDNLRVVQKRKI